VIEKYLPYLETTMREIEPGEHYELNVALKPPYPNAPARTTIQLRTGVEEDPRMVIHLSADFPPRVRVIPRQFVLPQDIEEPVERTVRLEWIDTTPGQIIRAEANVPELTCRPEERDGRQYVVLSAPAGYSRAMGTYPKVTITTDDDLLPSFTVPISFARKSERARVRGRSLDPTLLERLRPAKPPEP
jgi:hypothetical protein